MVSRVADHMGPRTDFDGIGKCEDGYEAAVKAFVDSIR